MSKEIEVENQYRVVHDDGSYGLWSNSKPIGHCIYEQRSRNNNGDWDIVTRVNDDRVQTDGSSALEDLASDIYVRWVANRRPASVDELKSAARNSFGAADVFISYAEGQRAYEEE